MAYAGTIARERFEAAEEAIRKALALRPHLETAHFNLGLVYEERGGAPTPFDSLERPIVTLTGPTGTDTP